MSKKVPLSISKTLQNLQGANALRQLRLPQSQLVDFSSNDYLGLAKIRFSENPEANLGATGSRLLSGNQPEHEKFEATCAEWLRADSTLLFSAGYLANLAVLSALPTRHDVIHYDEAVHASIKDGMRLSFAKKVSFGHQNYAQLAQNLAKGSGDQFVVAEALYSMDGDLARLKELIAVCEKAGAWLILDEAHSTGIYGPQGAGWLVENGLSSKALLRIHTFGKAVGRAGAVVAGPKEIREFLVNRARPFIYTTAMPPEQVVSLQNAVEWIMSEEGDEARGALQANCLQFAKKMGFETSEAISPIVPILVPGNDAVKATAEKLVSAGLDARPILAPTVQRGQERLRIVLHAFNSISELEKLAKNLRD